MRIFNSSHYFLYKKNLPKFNNMNFVRAHFQSVQLNNKYNLQSIMQQLSACNDIAEM